MGNGAVPRDFCAQNRSSLAGDIAGPQRMGILGLRVFGSIAGLLGRSESPSEKCHDRLVSDHGFRSLSCEHGGNVVSAGTGDMAVATKTHPVAPRRAQEGLARIPSFFSNRVSERKTAMVVLAGFRSPGNLVALRGIFRWLFGISRSNSVHVPRQQPQHNDGRELLGSIRLLGARYSLLATPDHDLDVLYRLDTSGSRGFAAVGGQTGIVSGNFCAVSSPEREPRLRVAGGRML